MKNKKSLILIIVAIVIIGAGVFYFFTRQDKDTSFTILEKQWLESNKNRVIDISILKDIPVIDYNGSGILFDFLNDFEDVTGLEFNRIASIDSSDVKTDYSFQVVSDKLDSDVLVFSDSYVFLTKNNVKYNKLSEISDMKIGVLNSDLDKISSVLDSNVTFKGFDSLDELVSYIDVSNVKTNENGEQVIDDTIDVIDGIIIPKMSNLNLIISNPSLNISYNINEIKQDYVLRLGSDEKLNDIINKYFNKWLDTKYDDSFNKHFSNNYFAFSSVDDKDKAEFKSKRYTYGFVENRPFDSLVNDDLYGINRAFLDSFSDVADIDIDYKRYDSKSSLVSAFNNGEIDVLFDNLGTSDFTVSNVDLVSNYDEEVVVLAIPDNKVTVGSIKALASYNVASISDTKISDYLTSYGINVDGYSSIDDLVSHVSSDSVIVVDSEIYNYYSSKLLSDYKPIYTFNMDRDYMFKVLNSNDNSIFINYFNFYLSFVSNQEVSNVGYSKLVDLTAKGSYRFVIIGGISVVVLGLLGLLYFQNRKSGSKEKVVVSKDSKIKYIDMLTSLKNRNYLNDNIEAWDESMVYPQGIVVVDLNNIAYINDNYGHTEGDKIIKEAANILIKTQISNTEIMRTNGNEFLIYMVGYDEKQIVSYIRKLNKEFKDLSHNFGAAIGYSTITDEIKTIDDAINEATLDMRNNKEESR